MNDNNDDDVDVGEVDGMGWGERMRWQDKTRPESGGNGTAGCDWGRGCGCKSEISQHVSLSFAMWPDRDS